MLHGDDSIVNWHPTGPLLATSGIESVVRLWEPKPMGCQDERVVKDAHKDQKNQQRMKVDPFEIMLMRMGFHVAAVNEKPIDNGPHGWIEDPTGCRQS